MAKKQKDDCGNNPEFKKDTDKLLKLSGIEIITILILWVTIYFSLVHNLWNQQYINSTVVAWEDGPITDLREIDPKEECNGETLIKHGVTHQNAALLKNGIYKIVGQGYWWNMQQGCQCPASGRFAEAVHQECTDIKSQYSCRNVRAQKTEMTMLPIVNGKKLCAFVDKSYNSLQIQKPVREKNDWVCKDAKVSQLCGYASLPLKNVNCIPATSKCPITQIYYDADGLLVTNSDPNRGPPIEDIRLSEGGPPCLDYHRNFNGFENKTKAVLFGPNYNSGCPTIEIDGHTFRTSRQYKKVEGFATTNEYDLMITNQKGSRTYPKQFNYVREVARYNENKMKAYSFDLYVKTYSHLHAQCQYDPTSSQTQAQADAKTNTAKTASGGDKTVPAKTTSGDDTTAPAKTTSADDKAAAPKTISKDDKATPAKTTSGSDTKAPTKTSSGSDTSSTTSSESDTPAKKFQLQTSTDLWQDIPSISQEQAKKNFDTVHGQDKLPNGNELITPEEMPFINYQANRMVGWVESLNITMIWMFIFAFFEFAMIFMFQQEALSKKAFDKIFMVRRGVQLLLFIIVVWTIFGIYGWTGHRFVDGLAEHKCSDDVMLQDTFNYMKKYIDQSQRTGMKIFMYVMIAALTVINIIGTVLKFIHIDKSYHYGEKHVHVKDENSKDTQLKEVLIKKKD